MSILYVRSTDGNNADSGATWALAKATVAGALAAAASGDTIYVSQVHAETQASAMTWTSPGVITNSVKIICGNDGAEPPTAVAATATVTTTGASAMNFNGCMYVEGIIFNCSSGATGAGFVFHNTTSAVVQTFKNCSFRLVGTASGNRIQFGGSGVVSGQQVVWLNCNAKMGNTGQRITLRNSFFIWSEGAWDSGGSTPTSIFIAGAAGIGAIARVSNVDFSVLTATVNILEQPNASATGSLLLVGRRCKMPSAWSGSVFSAAPAVAGIRAEWDSCDGGDTNYKEWTEDYSGSLRDDIVLVRTGGASDGTTQMGWKIVGSANVIYPHQVFVTKEMNLWNDTTGSSKTLTVNFIYNGASKLQNGDAWLEAVAYATSGFPLGTVYSSAKASILTAAADYSTNTEAWDGSVTARGNLTAYVVGDRIKVASNPGRVFFCTTAGTTGVSEAGGFATAVDGGSVTDTTAVFRAGWRQHMAVTFTPQKKGSITGRLVMAKNGDTFWADPKGVLS